MPSLYIQIQLSNAIFTCMIDRFPLSIYLESWKYLDQVDSPTSDKLFINVYSYSITLQLQVGPRPHGN